jgi:hypothetical protein
MSTTFKIMKPTCEPKVKKNKPKLINDGQGLAGTKWYYGTASFSHKFDFWEKKLFVIYYK